MEHTKGPWRIRVNKNDDQDTCDMSICGDIFVLADINGPQYPHQKANARLIAAAPDLIEALKMAQMWLDWDGRYDMQGINAAISKATGAA